MENDDWIPLTQSRPAPFTWVWLKGDDWVDIGMDAETHSFAWSFLDRGNNDRVATHWKPIPTDKPLPDKLFNYLYIHSLGQWQVPSKLLSGDSANYASIHAMTTRGIQ